jgi:hypothetical protein
MRILAQHSHFNGLECLLVRHKTLWQELVENTETVRTREELVQNLSKNGWYPTAAGLIKDRIALNFPDAEHECTANHLAAFVRDEIDVGIEIFLAHFYPANVYSNDENYGHALHSLARNGRGVPAVPLVMIGIAP